MRRPFAIFANIERALWQSRTAILIFAGGFAIARMIWLYAPLSEQARYPVREMLVNSAGGFVRRGLSGDVVLFLSDSVGGPPTAWATAMLAGLGIALFATCTTLFRKMPNDPSLAPFVLAPWGLMFLAYDIDILIRKEVFGYLALSTVLIGATSPSSRMALACMTFSSLLMPLAIFIHEVNATLAAPMLIAAWLLLQNHPTLKRPIIWLTCSAALFSLLATAIVLSNTTTSLTAMCAAINDPWCHAPFSYFSDTFSDGAAFVKSEISMQNRAVTAGILLLSLLPFAGVRLARTPPISMFFITAILIVPVSPLFLVGADYGRWIALIAFPSSLLVATALSLGLVSYNRILPSWATLLYCGTWSIYHYQVKLQAQGLQIWIFFGLALLLGALLTRARRSTAAQAIS